jgi:hypothetical protein
MITSNMISKMFQTSSIQSLQALFTEVATAYIESPWAFIRNTKNDNIKNDNIKMITSNMISKMITPNMISKMITPKMIKSKMIT